MLIQLYIFSAKLCARTLHFTGKYFCLNTVYTANRLERSAWRLKPAAVRFQRKRLLCYVGGLFAVRSTYLAVAPWRRSIGDGAVSQPAGVGRRVALNQRSKVVQFQALEQVGLLTTLGHAVAQLEDHVTLAVLLLFTAAN